MSNSQPKGGTKPRPQSILTSSLSPIFVCHTYIIGRKSRRNLPDKVSVGGGQSWPFIGGSNGLVQAARKSNPGAPTTQGSTRLRIPKNIESLKPSETSYEHHKGHILGCGEIWEWTELCRLHANASTRQAVGG